MNEKLFQFKSDPRVIFPIAFNARALNALFTGNFLFRKVGIRRER